jgi:HSP20 family protein
MSKDSNGFGDLGKEIESLFTDTFGTIGEPLLDVGSQSLRPLFSIDVNDEVVTATFDLPGVSRDRLAITCTEDTISVEAEMARPVRLSVSRGRREQREFLRYSRKVLLPVRVDPERSSARFRNGIAVVKLPRLREGRPIPIGEAPDPKRTRKRRS